MTIDQNGKRRTCLESRAIRRTIRRNRIQWSVRESMFPPEILFGLFTQQPSAPSRKLRQR
jgi:hypothetical protein